MRRSYFVSAALVVGLGACAGKDFSQFKTLGSSVLSSTGLVSGSQADTFFEVGGKFAKGLEGLTEHEEYYLGRGVSATILSKYQVVKNDSLVRYVNKVGKTLALQSDRPETFGGYHFALLNTDEVNAVSAPGGFVFVSKGFVRNLSSEDMLAAVLAHEIGHVVHGHARKAISESNLSDAVLTAAREGASSQGGFVTQQLTSAFGDSIHEATGALLTTGFSRSQEYEADEYAAELLKRSGYNPQALLAVLNKLKELSEKNEEGGWFSTHPAPQKRISEVEEVIAEGGFVVGDGENIRTKRFSQVVKSLG